MVEESILDICLHDLLTDGKIAVININDVLLRFIRKHEGEVNSEKKS